MMDPTTRASWLAGLVPAILALGLLALAMG